MYILIQCYNNEEIRNELLIKINSQIEIQDQFIKNYKIYLNFFNDDYIFNNKLIDDSILFPFFIFFEIFKDFNKANERQKIFINSWNNLMDESKQLINLIKYERIENEKNIASSFKTKQPNLILFELENFESWYNNSINWAEQKKDNFQDAKIFPYSLTHQFVITFDNILKGRKENFNNLDKKVNKCLNKNNKRLKIECFERDLADIEKNRIYLYSIYIKIYTLYDMFSYLTIMKFCINSNTKMQHNKYKNIASKVLQLLYSLQHIAYQGRKVLKKQYKQQRNNLLTNLNIQVHNPSHIVLSELRNFYLNLCEE
ncbi:hypothetical protein Mgra_00005272 [Meloidogyne graminicola]|uniref:Uncharacterized protein n=1 Tax=Meloidogyne graminicola TaxID=189291 RepID=A0A8S9ZPD6_9BILA|nr:hypothetical protein Mgra_00005272 [Meloidogyne graminicola]